MFSSLDQTLTTILCRHDNLYLDGLARAVGTPLVWLPMLLLALYVVIRSHSSALGIFQVVVASLVCLFSSEILAHLAHWLLPEERPVWLVPMTGARRYGLLSFITQNAMALAVWMHLLFRYRRLSIFLVLWALACHWSQVYMGLETACYVLLSVLSGGVAASLTYAGYLRLSVEGSVVPSRRRGVRTRTGYGEDDARLLLLCGIVLCLLCAFLAIL